MANPAEELFVQFLWECECDAELQVHGEHYVGFRVGFDSGVPCPKCGKQHNLPTRTLRFFVREGQVWNRVDEQS